MHKLKAIVERLSTAASLEELLPDMHQYGLDFMEVIGLGPRYKVTSTTEWNMEQKELKKVQTQVGILNPCKRSARLSAWHGYSNAAVKFLAGKAAVASQGSHSAVSTPSHFRPRALLGGDASRPQILVPPLMDSPWWACSGAQRVREGECTPRMQRRPPRPTA